MMRFLRLLLITGLLLLLLNALSEKRENNVPATVKHEQSPLSGRDYVWYTVQPGDTLGNIERKFRVSSRDSILALNQDMDPDVLQAGKRIKIPLQ